jgi:murein DD-endopeptidase MepM/ murein hydrolase activator NlpD
MRKLFIALFVVAAVVAVLTAAHRTPYEIVLVSSPSSPPSPSPASPDPAIPLPHARERVTLKPFGIRVSPEDSPVSPERFSGYHTGTDFEILPDEDETTLTVRALCVGQVIGARRISGYGGVVTQQCSLGGRAVIVLYGHLAPASLAKSGAMLASGDPVGTLGRGYSSDADDERPHLHLGIINGAREDVRGYVVDPRQLEGWLDPLMFIP